MIQTLVDIVIFFVAAKALYLAKILFNLFDLFDSNCINSCHQRIILLMPITLLTRTRILLIWPKSGLAKLGWLFISIISRTKKEDFLASILFSKFLVQKSRWPLANQLSIFFVRVLGCLTALALALVVYLIISFQLSRYLACLLN